MRINKYKELYDEYLRLLVEVHNANIEYRRRQNRLTTKRLRKALSDLRALTLPIRQEIQSVQHDINSHTKANFARLQKLKKENNNGHDNSTNSEST